MSGLTRLQFEELLGKRRIKRHYGETALEEDLGVRPELNGNFTI
ncbi:MAG: hypothetical protein WB392_00780 [Methanotrichaceae archaeon]